MILSAIEMVGETASVIAKRVTLTSDSPLPRVRHPRDSGFVYLLRIAGTDFYKIGWTKYRQFSVRKRCQQWTKYSRSAAKTKALTLEPLCDLLVVADWRIHRFAWTVEFAWHDRLAAFRVKFIGALDMKRKAKGQRGTTMTEFFHFTPEEAEVVMNGFREGRIPTLPPPEPNRKLRWSVKELREHLKGNGTVGGEIPSSSQNETVAAGSPEIR